MKKSKDLKRLTKKERKIYDAILRSFPATKHDCTMDYALKGGAKFQFYPK